MIELRSLLDLGDCNLNKAFQQKVNCLLSQISVSNKVRALLVRNLFSSCPLERSRHSAMSLGQSKKSH